MLLSLPSILHFLQPSDIDTMNPLFLLKTFHFLKIFPLLIRSSNFCLVLTYLSMQYKNFSPFILSLLPPFLLLLLFSLSLCPFFGLAVPVAGVSIDRSSEGRNILNLLCTTFNTTWCPTVFPGLTMMPPEDNCCCFSPDGTLNFSTQIIHSISPEEKRSQHSALFVVVSVQVH